MDRICPCGVAISDPETACVMCKELLSTTVVVSLTTMTPIYLARVLRLAAVALLRISRVDAASMTPLEILRRLRDPESKVHPHDLLAWDIVYCLAANVGSTLGKKETVGDRQEREDRILGKSKIRRMDQVRPRGVKR